MIKYFLMALLCAASAHAYEVLFIGNSRTSMLDDYADSITHDLGYTTYLNRGVGGYTCGNILSALDADLALAGDNLKRIIFMDATNNTNGVTDLIVTRNDIDSIITKCLRIVGPDSFVFVQSGPNSNAYGAYDSAVVITSGLSRGSRSKTGAIQNMEYDFVVSKGVRGAFCFDYLSKRNFTDSSWYADPTLYSDGTHYNDAGYEIIRAAINEASVKASKRIVSGNGIEGTWKCWQLKGAAAISGDTNTGNLSIPSGDSVISPVRPIGFYQKIVSVSPALALGSVTAYVRYSDSYFKNTSTIPWVTLSGNNTTIKNFCQLMLVASGETVVDSLVFTWSNSPFVSGYKAFGNRENMVRDWHKDAPFYVNNGTAFGDAQNLVVMSTANSYKSMMRIGFDYDIPPTSIIDSAKLHVFVYEDNIYPVSIGLRPFNIAHGYSKYWDEGTQNQTPTPSLSQATWFRSKAPDIGWHSDSITPLDYGDTIDGTMQKTASMAVGTEIVMSVKNLVSVAVADTADYYGWALTGEGGYGYTNLYSQNALNSSWRPYVEVWFRSELFVTTTSADPHAPITGGNVPGAAGGYDTLVMAPDSGYGARLAGRSMVIWPNHDTLIVQRLNDSTVISVAYPIPVIDSIRDSTRVRDPAYPQTARITDYVKIRGRHFGTLGDSTIVSQSSTGNTRFRVSTFSDTLIVARPSLSSQRGSYQPWIRTKDMASGVPKSRGLIIQIPSTGSSP
jgi:hypothetical protein